MNPMLGLTSIKRLAGKSPTRHHYLKTPVSSQRLAEGLTIPKSGHRDAVVVGVIVVECPEPEHGAAVLRLYK
jgi:hypothetical protein